TLIGIYLGSGDAGRAATLLEETRQLFGGEAAQGVWTLLRTQVAASSGDPRIAAAIDDAAETAAEPPQVRVLALASEASETGNWEPFIRHLQTRFEQTNDLRYLLDFAAMPA